jgi:hypothetical protein
MRPIQIPTTVKIIGIPILAALAFLVIFDAKSTEDAWQIMSFTFYLSLPYLVGALTIHLSPIEKVKSKKYRIFFPWMPILGFLILTLVIALEGWACWIMVLPLFLGCASLGGIATGYFKLKKAKQANLHLSLVVLIPFIIGPIEKAIGERTEAYNAYTYIDIHAPQDKIWSNVTRVREIEETENQAYLTRFLQMPRPIKAELDYEGVGAKREASFSGGLTFTETVLTYQHQKEMTFSIKANTNEIPPTTFDEHIIIGGKYFDVLTGTYKLEPIGNQQYRLHLTSQFKFTTTFNSYASLWGRWIMADIQNNILKIIKKRSEQE